MAVNTNLAYALGAGSGVDTKSLAQSLVEAEKAPRQQAIESKIQKSEAKISGYGALMAILANLKSAFEGLNETGDFNSFATFNSNPSAFTATTSSSASPANHSIEVVSLATAQRTASDGFAEADTELNGGSAFSLTLTVNGEEQSIRVASSQSTPSGIVESINSAGLGVTAQLLNTGDGSGAPYRIVLVGEEGVDNAFTMASDDASGTGEVQKILFGDATESGTITVAGVAVSVTAGDTAATVAGKVKTALENDVFITNVLGRSITNNGDGSLNFQFAASDGNAAGISFDGSAAGLTATVSDVSAFVAGSAVTGVSFATSLKTASDATVRIDGLPISRTSNTFSDVISGVSLELLAPTTSAATLSFNRDPAPIKEKLQTLIAAYNDAVSDFGVLTGEPNKEDEEDIYSGSLRGDSTARGLLYQIRSMVTSTSSAAGENLTALRDLGVELSRDGTLSLNEATFNTAVSDHYAEMVTMLTGDASFQSLVGDLSRGVAGDAVKSLTDFMKSDGSLMTQTDGAEATISRYEADLEKLDERMKLLLERYTRQFAVMDTLVGQFTRQREGLVSTFEGLANMYKK